MTDDRKKGRTAALLQAAGIRPTRQRCFLASFLFAKPHKHVTAEDVHQAATKRHVQLSLATVYNNLHEFTKAGLLNKVVIDEDRLYFDTNTGPHHHLYNEDTGALVDIDLQDGALRRAISVPKNLRISKIEVTVRVAKISSKTRNIIH